MDEFLTFVGETKEYGICLDIPECYNDITKLAECLGVLPREASAYIVFVGKGRALFDLSDLLLAFLEKVEAIQKTAQK